MISLGVIRSFLGVAVTSVLGGGTLPLLICAGLVASHGFIYFKGASHQAAKCQAAAMSDTIDEQAAAIGRLKSQLQIARQVRDAATRRWEVDARETQKSKAEANVFKIELRSRVEQPGTFCRPNFLSPGDAKRLRQIGR